MINAPHDKEFIFHDGTRAKNILELVARLEHMHDHEFRHFVNFHKNDFANWIDHVLLDKHLAGKLRTVDSRNDTIKILTDRINDVALNNEITGHHLQPGSHTTSSSTSSSQSNSSASAVNQALKHESGNILHHVKVGDSIIKIPKLDDESKDDLKHSADYSEYNSSNYGSKKEDSLIEDLKKSKDSESADTVNNSNQSNTPSKVEVKHSQKKPGFIQRSKEYFAKKHEERKLKKAFKKKKKEDLKEAKRKMLEEKKRQKDEKKRAKESEKQSKHLDKAESRHDAHFKDSIKSNTSVGTIGLSAKERVHEQKESVKSKKSWFKVFSRKTISEDELAKLEFEEEDKLRPERELLEEIDNDGRENALWVALYVILVLLIITLLIYKLFL